jgi:hypothetical protein
MSKALAQKKELRVPKQLSGHVDGRVHTLFACYCEYLADKPGSVLESLIKGAVGLDQEFLESSEYAAYIAEHPEMELATSGPKKSKTISKVSATPNREAAKPKAGAAGA